MFQMSFDSGTGSVGSNIRMPSLHEAEHSKSQLGKFGDRTVSVDSISISSDDRVSHNAHTGLSARKSLIERSVSESPSHELGLTQAHASDKKLEEWVAQVPKSVDQILQEEEDRFALDQSSRKDTQSLKTLAEFKQQLSQIRSLFGQLEGVAGQLAKNDLGQVSRSLYYAQEGLKSIQLSLRAQKTLIAELAHNPDDPAALFRAKKELELMETHLESMQQAFGEATKAATKKDKTMLQSALNKAQIKFGDYFKAYQALCKDISNDPGRLHEKLKDQGNWSALRSLALGTVSVAAFAALGVCLLSGLVAGGVLAAGAGVATFVLFPAGVYAAYQSLQSFKSSIRLGEDTASLEEQKGNSKKIENKKTSLEEINSFREALDELGKSINNASSLYADTYKKADKESQKLPVEPLQAALFLLSKNGVDARNALVGALNNDNFDDDLNDDSSSPQDLRVLFNHLWAQDSQKGLDLIARLPVSLTAPILNKEPNLALEFLPSLVKEGRSAKAAFILWMMKEQGASPELLQKMVQKLPKSFMQDHGRVLKHASPVVALDRLDPSELAYQLDHFEGRMSEAARLLFDLSDKHIIRVFRAMINEARNPEGFNKVGYILNGFPENRRNDLLKNLSRFLDKEDFERLSNIAEGIPGSVFDDE